MGMGTVDTPKVVDDDIEYAQQSNKEHCRIFRFKSNSNHDTCKKTKSADCNTNCTPTISLENETEEEEDEKDSTGELEVCTICR